MDSIIDIGLKVYAVPTILKTYPPISSLNKIFTLAREKASNFAALYEVTLRWGLLDFVWNLNLLVSNLVGHSKDRFSC